MQTQFFLRDNVVYKKEGTQLNIVGAIAGSWFITTREHYHYFIKYGGFGLSRNLIKLLLKNKIEKIKIRFKKDTYTVVMYRTTISKFLDDTKRVEYYDNGDVQYILTVKYMHK